jgi:hypothetical protein
VKNTPTVEEWLEKLSSDLQIITRELIAVAKEYAECAGIYLSRRSGILSQQFSIRPNLLRLLYQSGYSCRIQGRNKTSDFSSEVFIHIPLPN